MNPEKRFYVYVHKYASGPKEGAVFYVGKGFGSRIYSSRGRSRWWNSIVKKYGKKNEFVAKDMHNHCAMTLEKIIIKKIGISNLCNITSGGEGMHGYKHSKSARDKISESNRRRIVSDETKRIFSERSKGREKSEKEKDSARKRMMGNKLTLGMKHSKETIELMSLLRSGSKHPNFDHEKKYFYHDDGRVFYGTMYDFCMTKSLCRKAISAVNTGERKSHKGWRIKRVSNEN